MLFVRETTFRVLNDFATLIVNRVNLQIALTANENDRDLQSSLIDLADPLSRQAFDRINIFKRVAHHDHILVLKALNAYRRVVILATHVVDH